MNKKFDVTVIGGGPGGMAAALAAAKEGVSVALLERDDKLGGILNQCIHNGFGLHYFGEELTGPEYAYRFKKQVEATPGITVFLDAMVLSVAEDGKSLSAVSPKEGAFTVETRALVFATGCRERTAGAISMCGNRPAGVYTAGMAQRLCNADGWMVGKNVVILGSGDIGLIMARRMKYEGADVKMVVELMPYSSGLKRNVVSCVEDFGIPLLFSTTITRVVGEKRVEGVYIASVDEKGVPKPETERFVPCDTVLLSVGLIPETELCNSLGLKQDAVTKSAFVDEGRQSSVPGVFFAGNCLHVHDLADNVTEEGMIAGRAAALFALQKTEKHDHVGVFSGHGVRYVLPQTAAKGQPFDLYFRVDKVYQRGAVQIKEGDNVIKTKKFAVVAPGEMQKIALSGVNGDVTVEIIGGTAE